MLHRPGNVADFTGAREFAQAAAAEQQVNHEQQHDGMRRIGALRQVPEALPQALFQPQPGEKPLEDHQPGVRRETLGGILDESKKSGGRVLV